MSKEICLEFVGSNDEPINKLLEKILNLFFPSMIHTICMLELEESVSINNLK